MAIFIIAELGINHNGQLEIAKQLIEVAREAGCDAVKLQKRTIDLVYSKEQLDQPLQSPWGTTRREQKLGLEFGAEGVCGDRPLLPRTGDRVVRLGMGFGKPEVPGSIRPEIQQGRVGDPGRYRDA